MRMLRLLPAVAVTAALVLVGSLEAADLTKLRVCADPTNLPFSSRDPATPGFEVELAQALVSDVSFHWVPTERWAFVARQLLDRRCDLVFGLPLDSRFVDDNPRIALSRPYYVMGQVLVTRAGSGIRRLDDLQDRPVAVQAMTPGDILVFQRGHARQVHFKPEDAVEAVSSGKAEAAVMWSSHAGWLMRKVPGLELTWIRDPEGEFKVAIGTRKADQHLRQAADRAVERLLADGKVKQILGRYGIPVLPAP
ncbi:MAG TPA: transporter substrate-binding domain-containing protein [Methylomirabilota bacterium]|nr:transporter substrate-binding domain-containing protein [Methylomirabilota bacterium]